MKKILTLIYIAVFLNFSVQSSIADIAKNNIADYEKNYINRYFYSSNLNNQALFDYIESTIYQSLIENLNDDYIVEEVSTIYLSKEYLELLEFNSQENIYFGYTLSELDAQFQGQKYIFTLGENGQTVVKPFEKYDDTFDKIIKNVAIGTGVILVCVTVSVVTGGAGLPAVSMIFAASAKTATIWALSGAASGAVISGAIEGVVTKDFNKAMKAAALGASEGFKWGAITGAAAGGFSEGIALKNIAQDAGKSMNEAARSMQKLGYSAKEISRIQKEYSALKKLDFNKCSYDGLKLGEPGSGKILRYNVEKSLNTKLPSGCEAHHIVPKKAGGEGSAASKCRAILDKFKIDINDPHNCAPLPKSKEIADLTRTIPHPGNTNALHGEKIMNSLYEQLSRATSKQDVFEILEDFRRGMLNNNPSVWL